MKIELPDASKDEAGSALSTKEGLSPSHPVSTPGSPISVTSKVGEGSSDSETSIERARTSRKRPRPVSNRKPRPCIARLVSHDFTSCHESQRQDTPCISSAGEEDDESAGDVSVDGIGPAVSYENSLDGSSPRSYSRRVSDLGNKAMSYQVDKAASNSFIPPFPNPLHHRLLRDAHVRSLAIERELAPMRQILFKLMSNPTYNRRGLFNSPVDHVALGLLDYTLIVTQPMDLGTVKAKLHALAYTCCDEAADDIRLVFHNAVMYNPQEQFVHVAARNLQGIFERSYFEIGKGQDGGDEAMPCARAGGLASAVDSNLYLAPSATIVTTSDKPASVCEPALQVPPAPANTPSDEAVCQSVTESTPCDNVVLQVHPASACASLAEAEVAVSVATRQKNPVATLPVHMNRGDGCTKPHPKLRANRKKAVAHSCTTCLGRACAMCSEGCITHEPTLLICNGLNCGGAKIRKGATYFVAKDGTRQYCQKCYSGLAAILPQSGDQHDLFGASVRYKRDLLKRKNDEEIAENWLTCSKCQQGVHQVCAMHNEFVHTLQDYVCPTCITCATKDVPASVDSAYNMDTDDRLYSFMSGLEAPVCMDEIVNEQSSSGHAILSADKLKQTSVSAFIESKVRERMVVPDCPHADRTVSVRIISDCYKSFAVPDLVRKHFRMAADSTESHLSSTALPPTRVTYKSKAVALFQKIDGLDVCIFCMYVQEYDGDDEYGDEQEASVMGQGRRVYIAYLDSVEHFRPRSCRTEVYHEMLVSYLATARARGYETAHIWACPPSRGNSFVFWNHPSSQRTPTRDRLISWYHGTLSRAVNCGIVTDVKSMYESAFHEFMSTVRDEEQGHSVDKESSSSRPGRMVCPPLLDGDFWIEEAQRIHAASILRYLKSKSGAKDARPRASASDDASDGTSSCPALQVASLLRNRVMALPKGAPFRRPVNAAAMNLQDYHKIIDKPMDLGTIYSHCVLGEYEDLREFVSDVELVFANARRFNPVGHIVHTMAVEMQDVFFQELNALTKQWDGTGQLDSDFGEISFFWLQYADVSMSLDKRLFDCSKPNSASVVRNNEPSSQTQALSEQNAVLSVEVTKQMELSVDSSDVRIQETEVKDAAIARDGLTSCSSGAAPASTSLAGAGGSVSVSEKGKKTKPPAKKLDLLTDGPDAVQQRMVGEDVWLLDKRNPIPPKGALGAKAKDGKRKNDAQDESPPSKRRRQSWLGEEVGMSMRRIRTSFFTCSLTPKALPSQKEECKLSDFDSYIAPYGELSRNKSDSHVSSSRIADARHALLEFSQYRNFEFDTLRRAKYSTSMLLYHLHNDDAPGLVPLCTSCSCITEHVRWHQIRKRSSRQAPSAEELCSECHALRSDGEKFIPLPVSFRN